MTGKQNTQVIWAPQAGPQKALIDCPFPEIFYGGARGGGKTDGVLGKYAIKAGTYGSGFNAIFFRRELPMLDDAIERSREIYGPIGATWQDQKKTWTFPNGGRLRFRPLERTADAEKYQGQNVTDITVEEAGNYPDPAPIDRLHGILRSAKGVPTQLIMTGNPGGPGQQWIKARYIDPDPRGFKVLTRKLPNGKDHRYVFIPSLLQNNRMLTQADPDYVNRLYLVGSRKLVDAWLNGDWSAVEGAYFEEWSQSHVVEPFDIPEHWFRMISGDWGSAKPFSFGWWAVASEDFLSPSGWIPKGAMVRYQEWYGVKRNESGGIEANVGLKLTAEEVGRGLAERGAECDRAVIDPAAFAEDGGPSLAERIRKAGGPYFQRADNKRVARNGAMGGWDQMRSRLKGEDFGEPMGERPMIFTFDTCTDSIRTIPALQHDGSRPEDLDSDMEDHCFAAGTLVDTPKGQIPIEKMAETGIVYTHLGPRRYRSCGLIKRQADTVEITFSDGRKVRCTKDHLFLTESGNWVPAEEMAGEWSYNITFEDDICQKLLVTPFKSFVGNAITCVESISRKMGSDYTALYGWTQMAQSPAGSTCITSTTTEQTTVLRTLNWFQGRPILSITPKGLGMEAGQSGLQHPTRQSGMVARTAELGIPSILKSTFARSWKSGFLQSAKNVAMSIWSARPELSRASIAQASAKHVRCVSVGKPRRDDVYCLTSPTTKTFSINGGIIVHNCADEWRYACMARPYVKARPDAPDRRPRDKFERALRDFEEADNWKVA